MKSFSAIIFLPVFFMAALIFSCRGECVRCSKPGEQTLNYCEGDFPGKQTYLDQINGLDSLGYECVPK
jgi:hypothetical protein